MKTNLLKITALSIALGVALIACDKTNSTITSSDQLANAVIDNQTANEQSESAYELVDDATFLPLGVEISVKRLILLVVVTVSFRC